MERHLWTGVGRARSGAGAAIVGDPDQVLAKINELTDAGTLLISKAYAAGASRPGQYVVHALLDPTRTLRARDLFGCAESGLLLAPRNSSKS